MSDASQFTGRLQAIDTIDLRPRVGGYVNSVEFKEGALARLRGSSGRTRQARAELLMIFEQFTEGFGTADLREERALLDQLN